MKLWKVDRKAVEIRLVDGEPYPGRDSEGEEVYQNRHFETRDDAVDWFHRDAEALISLTAVDVETAERELLKARERAGNAVKYAARVASVFPR